MISVRMLPARAGRTIGGALAATAASLATATAATAARRLKNPFTMIAPRLAPHTVQLCIHCRQDPAGFLASRTCGMPVQRPWCLSCCRGLDPGRCHRIPFDGHGDIRRCR